MSKRINRGRDRAFTAPWATPGSLAPESADKKVNSSQIEITLELRNKYFGRGDEFDPLTQEAKSNGYIDEEGNMTPPGREYIQKQENQNRKGKATSSDETITVAQHHALPLEQGGRKLLGRSGYGLPGRKGHAKAGQYDKEGNRMENIPAPKRTTLQEWQDAYKDIVVRYGYDVSLDLIEDSQGYVITFPTGEKLHAKTCEKLKDELLKHFENLNNQKR